MFQDTQHAILLPTDDEVRRAVLLYLEHAYGATVPPDGWGITFQPGRRESKGGNYATL